MYPARELNRLAGRKAVYRRKIGRHRAQCVRAIPAVIAPLAALDRLAAWWRRLAPLAAFAALPLGLLLKRSSAPRPRLLASLLQWGPTALGILRHLRATPPL